MHEFVTLQLGQRANYLLTHFWNIQESYFTYSEGEETPIDHDVHFRPGIGADGSETFTPRTVIYDLKGAFGTLRKQNALYELSEDSVPGQGLWDGREVIQQQTLIPQSEYQKNLDEGLPAPKLTSETVRYWSDYNRVFYHPRSIVQLNDYELNSRTMPFEDWGVGEELFNDLDKEHDLLDRDVRPFAEECDQLRGLQVFTGSDDAWGGFAAKYIDRLRDEFGKKSIWTWAIEGGARLQRHQQIKRDLNKARSVYNIAEQSSLYTPIIDPPHRIPGTYNLDLGSEWYTSALIASALETVTLPSRLRHYHDFEAALAGDDAMHRIFELQSTVVQDGPDGRMQLDEGQEDTESKIQTEFDVDFTYDNLECANAHVFNQIQVSRGINPKQVDPSVPTHDIGSVRRRRHYNSEPMLQSFHTPLQFPLLDSFPSGMLPTSTPDAGVSVLAGLTSSSRTADALKGLESVAGRMIEVDERETLVNGLGEIRESYETGWNSESDFDDD